MPEDSIAGLDGDWSEFVPRERVAFALARKLSFEPHHITNDDIDQLRPHYTDLQILEIILSVASNNSTNRWKEGVGVPQEREATRFLTRAEKPVPMDRPLPIKSFLTPTADKFKHKITSVAPLQSDKQSGKPTHETVFQRPALESRAAVEAALLACQQRKPRLPLVTEGETREVVGDAWPEGSLPQWVRLLANFPAEGKSRVASLRTAQEKGELTPLLKAQISWIIARQDRAWYAVGQAKKRLQALGWSDDQIYSLDGDWKNFTEMERSFFVFARDLAAAPIVLTDAEVTEALQQSDPARVVQLISYTTNQALFTRVTEAAGLQLEQ